MISKEEHLKKGRKVILGIVILGFIVLSILNWNANIVIQGNRYDAEVTSIRTVRNTSGNTFHNSINVEYIRRDSVVSANVQSFTKNFLNMDRGDKVILYESKTHPYEYYLPRANLTPSLLIFAFFVAIPLIFGIFGKV